jgi:hypothetical protein
MRTIPQTLNTGLAGYCTRCGARPRERCRAVIRRDTGHGQELKAPHARRGGTGWITADCAERVRAALSTVWEGKR